MSLLGIVFYYCKRKDSKLKPLLDKYLFSEINPYIVPNEISNSLIRTSKQINRKRNMGIVENYN